MFEDASLLRDYYRTPQGRHVAMWLRRALAEFWVRAPNASNAAIDSAFAAFHPTESVSDVRFDSDLCIVGDAVISNECEGIWPRLFYDIVGPVTGIDHPTSVHKVT